MDISSIDKNFSFETALDREGLVFYDVRKEPFHIYGLHNPLDASLPFHRLDCGVAEATSQAVKTLNFRTAGGRVRFATNSPFIAIRCETAESIQVMTSMPLSGSQGFDLYRISEDGTPVYQTVFMCPADRIGKVGFENLRELPKDGKVYQYILNFPLYGTVKNLAIGLHKDAILTEGARYKYEEKPFLFYGSSITQGGCASRPGMSYQALLTHEFDFDYINLGFSGNAKGEPVMADYLATFDPLIFFCDYDHNAPSLDHLQNTLPPLYETFRRAHPDTPFIFITSPGMSSGQDRRDFIEETFLKAKENGDQNVYFVDGSKMFDEMKPNTCRVDLCHPTDLGFYCMAKSIGAVIRQILEKL